MKVSKIPDGTKVRFSGLRLSNGAVLWKDVAFRVVGSSTFFNRTTEKRQIHYCIRNKRVGLLNAFRWQLKEVKEIKGRVRAL